MFDFQLSANFITTIIHFKIRLLANFQIPKYKTTKKANHLVRFFYD